jgi:uncharacterized protein with ParB-like and HNH nuclease domain
MGEIIVDSDCHTLTSVLNNKYEVDFYQREYVWEKSHIEDLINDLVGEFMKNWSPNDDLSKTKSYNPYFMGEIVLSKRDNHRYIIDGQQRITTMTLLLIYLLKKYGHVNKFPDAAVRDCIYSDDFGEMKFNLEVPERKQCMNALYNVGTYDVQANDTPSVQNMVDRYMDFEDVWDERITEENVVSFVYWIKDRIFFSEVWTNSDDFAYVIFETMNDRGMSLTQVEMLRSYLLANVDETDRNLVIQKFDTMIGKLTSIKLSSKSKAEFEFFKMYFRSHYANDANDANPKSDFTRIGKEFHRWVRDNEIKLALKNSNDFIGFIDRLVFFSSVYEKINALVAQRNTNKYLYLIVNSDYGFTLQPALILASVKFGDSSDIIEEKIQLVSKYLTKVLSWRVWNHYLISQNSMEKPIYSLCMKIRDKDISEIKDIFDSNPIEIPDITDAAPTLNQQNRKKLKVLISLITEIVASASGQPDYLLNKDVPMEIEHIWADHFNQHEDEFDSESEFASIRNNIGDLLVLPKQFNASYGDDPYQKKVVQYFSQNILAQSLHKDKYQNNPGFLNFKTESGLPFEAYESFKRNDIMQRAKLYKYILLWNWGMYDKDNPENISSVSNREAALSDGTVLYYTRTRGADANGYPHSGSKHFTVRKGSRVSQDIVSIFEDNYKNAFDLRNALISDGTIANRIFTKDYTFDTSSLAISVIIGRNASGNGEWKTVTNQTLGDSSTGVEGTQVEFDLQNRGHIQHGQQDDVFEDVEDLKYCIIKVKDDTIQERGNLYEAVRKHWKVDLERISKIPYVLASNNGVIKEVYKVERWYDADSEEYQGRCMFDGNVAPEDIRQLFVGKHLPEHYKKKGMAAPILYHD